MAYGRMRPKSHGSGGGSVGRRWRKEAEITTGAVHGAGLTGACLALLFSLTSNLLHITSSLISPHQSMVTCTSALRADGAALQPPADDVRGPYMMLHLAGVRAESHPARRRVHLNIPTHSSIRLQALSAAIGFNGVSDYARAWPASGNTLELLQKGRYLPGLLWLHAFAACMLPTERLWSRSRSS